MKNTASLILSCILLCPIFGQASDISRTRPSLSLVKASEIASDAFLALELPSGYFLHQIAVFYPPDEPQHPVYKAYFDPPKKKLIKTDSMIDSDRTYTFRYIKITMIGSASLVTEVYSIKDDSTLSVDEKPIHKIQG